MLLVGSVAAADVPELGEPETRDEVRRRLGEAGCELVYSPASERWLARLDGPVPELEGHDPVVALGDFTMLLPDHEHVYAFTRRLDDVTLTVLGNFSGEQQEVPLDVDPGELVLGNYDGGGARTSVLRPWEAQVYRRSAA